MTRVGNIIAVQRDISQSAAALLLNCGDKKAETAAVAPQDGDWETQLDTADSRWNVPGALMPTGIRPFGKVGVTVASSAMLLMKERKD